MHTFEGPIGFPTVEPPDAAGVVVEVVVAAGGAVEATGAGVSFFFFGSFGAEYFKESLFSAGPPPLNENGNCLLDREKIKRNEKGYPPPNIFINPDILCYQKFRLQMKFNQSQDIFCSFFWCVGDGKGKGNFGQEIVKVSHRSKKFVRTLINFFFVFLFKKTRRRVSLSPFFPSFNLTFTVIL